MCRGENCTRSPVRTPFWMGRHATVLGTHLVECTHSCPGWVSHRPFSVLVYSLNGKEGLSTLAHLTDCKEFIPGWKLATAPSEKGLYCFSACHNGVSLISFHVFTIKGVKLVFIPSGQA